MKLLHLGDMGDVVYSLPCVRAFAERYGPVELYLKPSESDHPFGGRHFTRAKIDWLIPLLAAQEYISSVQVSDDQEVDLDLNLFRKLNINFGASDICHWYKWAFPVQYDQGKPWLTVEGEKNDRIIVNRTERYRNPGITYRFLAGLRVQFVGLPDEYDEFVKQVPDAEYLPVDDALVLAKLLKGCRLFVGNQSAPYALAEGLKVPRVLEVCPSVPNVIPHGPGGYDAVTQLGFEWAVNRLLGDT